MEEDGQVDELTFIEGDRGSVWRMERVPIKAQSSYKVILLNKLCSEIETFSRLSLLGMLAGILPETWALMTSAQFMSRALNLYLVILNQEVYAVGQTVVKEVPCGY